MTNAQRKELGGKVLAITLDNAQMKGKKYLWKVEFEIRERGHLFGRTQICGYYGENYKPWTPWVVLDVLSEERARQLADSWHWSKNRTKRIMPSFDLYNKMKWQRT